MLPAGWEWTKLGAVLARIEAGRSPKNQGRPARDGEFGVLKVSAVSWGEFLSEENKALLPGDIAEAELTVRAGDLLISRANTTELVGAVVYVEREYPNLMLSDKTLRLVPTPKADPKFLLYALRLPLARDFFAKGATGTSDSMRNISQDKIREVSIPLPPLAEQRRIVERVEALLAQAHTAREALAPVTARARRLRQAVLAAAFSGRLSEREPSDEPAGELLERIRAERALLGGRRGRGEARALPEGLPELPEGWTWARLGDVVARVEAGRSPKNQGRPAQDGEFGVLKVSAVSWGKFLPEENKALLQSDIAEPELTVRSGDLLISRANTTELVGAVVYVEHDYPNLMLSDKTLRLVPSADIEPKFLLYALRLPLARDFFAKSATGTSDSMRNISQERLREVQLPLAPLAEQRRIVARVEALLAHADVIEQAVAATSARIADMERAVLARAFRGGLVEQLTTGRIRTLS